LSEKCDELLLAWNIFLIHQKTTLDFSTLGVSSFRTVFSYHFHYQHTTTKIVYNGTSKCKDSLPCNDKQETTEHVRMRSAITGIQKALLFYVLKISSLNLIKHISYHEKGFPRLSSVPEGPR
jgi:hypothetical protein